MMATTPETDPYHIDVLAYLADLNGDLSPAERHKYYQAIKPALLRAQQEDAALFDVALHEVKNTLKISLKTVKADLAQLAEPPAAKKATELLEQMGQTRPLRLAQDFVNGLLWYGIVVGEDKLLLNSARKLLTLDDIPEGLTVRDRGFDDCRLSKDAILQFMKGRTEAAAPLVSDLRTFLTRFAVFRDKRLPLLLAAWTLGTYCYRVFRVFPYLSLRSPDKRCGKSRVLDLLSLLAFNASPRTVNPTEAEIFRGPSRNGGTLLLDEVEALGKANKDTYAGLLSVLNSGFEQGGSVSRLEKNGTGNYEPASFETYCPRALAGINRMAETLEDRSIMIVMQRKLAREPTERFSPGKLDPEARALRDRCYLWALTHAAELAAIYDRADEMFAELAALDDRARDLWEPLLSIVALADTERDDEQKTLTDELAGLALDLSQVREGVAEDSITVQVIKALQEIYTEKRQNPLWQQEAGIIITPTELTASLKTKLGWERLSPKGLANLLAPLGISSKNTKWEAKVIKAYHLTAHDLSELSERYTQSSTEKDEKK